MPEGIPEGFDYAEDFKATFDRLSKVKAGRYGNAWKFAKGRMTATTTLRGEGDKPLRAEWMRLHCPPVAVFEAYSVWKERGGDEVDLQADAEGARPDAEACDGEFRDPELVASKSGEFAAVVSDLPAVSEPVSDALEPESRAILNIVDANVAIPLDNSMPFDGSTLPVPADWEFKDILAGLRWAAQNFHFVATKRVKVRDVPKPEFLLFVDAALKNSPGFVKDILNRAIEYDREKTQKERASRQEILDDNRPVFKILDRLGAGREVVV